MAQPVVPHGRLSPTLGGSPVGAGPGSGFVAGVGATPLVPLARIGGDLDVHGKVEGANPGGSIKDRVAVKLVQHAVQGGRLRAGDRVVESSSGNMAVALAQVCPAFDLQFTAVIDPGINTQTRRLLLALGASLEEVDDPDDQGSHLAARRARVRDIVAADPRAWWPNQYANPAVPAAHRRTMVEIIDQLGGAPDVVIAATGTCGTIVGLADHLRAIGAGTTVVAADAVGSRIFDSPPRVRRLPGHGSSRPSDLLRPGLVDEVVHVDELAAIRGARRLLRREGIMAGASAGAVVAALDDVAGHLDAGATVVLVLADRGDRYLDTVFDDCWVRRTYGVDVGAWL